MKVLVDGVELPAGCLQDSDEITEGFNLSGTSTIVCGLCQDAFVKSSRHIIITRTLIWVCSTDSVFWAFADSLVLLLVGFVGCLEPHQAQK